jgi:hypothetical protein
VTSSDRPGPTSPSDLQGAEVVATPGSCTQRRAARLRAPGDGARGGRPGDTCGESAGLGGQPRRLRRRSAGASSTHHPAAGSPAAQPHPASTNAHGCVQSQGGAGGRARSGSGLGQQAGGAGSGTIQETARAGPAGSSRRCAVCCERRGFEFLSVALSDFIAYRLLRPSEGADTTQGVPMAPPPWYQAGSWSGGRS